MWIIKPTSSLVIHNGKMMDHVKQCSCAKRSMASDTFGMATSHLPPSDKCATLRHTIVAPLTSPPLLEGLRNWEHWECCEHYKKVNNSASNKCLVTCSPGSVVAAQAPSSPGFVLHRLERKPFLGCAKTIKLCHGVQVPRKTKPLSSGPAVNSSTLRSWGAKMSKG